MNPNDIHRARINMVESQIRAWDVLDSRVLDLITAMPREDFVPAAYRNLAFADINIPLAHGQVMMAPKLEGRLLQALDVQPADTILEIGTGSGYLTALLAKLASHVFSIEIFPEMQRAAASKLAAHGIRNVTLELGDAARGWDQHAPYDVIAVTGSLPELPQAFPESLRVGGRMFVVLGQSPVMDATLITRESRSGWRREVLFETDLPPLVNAYATRRFVL